MPCLALAVGDGQEPPDLACDVERLVKRLGGHVDGSVVHVRSRQVDIEDGATPELGMSLDDPVWRLLAP